MRIKQVIVGIVKNINSRARRNKETKKILEVDNLKYEEENRLEAERIKASLQREGVLVADAAITR